MSGTSSRRLGDGAFRLEDLALDAEHVQHLLGADVRAGDLVDGLCSGAQRDDEEGGVPVESDQVADVDLPREREVGPEPGDEARRRGPGTSTWAASSVDCGSATRTPARRTSWERA